MQHHMCLDEAVCKPVLTEHVQAHIEDEQALASWGKGSDRCRGASTELQQALFHLPVSSC